MNWQVGQEVMIVGGRRSGDPKPGVVTKRGRKYVTVECVEGWPNPRQYHMDTGREKSDYSQTSRITTPELLAAEKRRADAIAAMKELGWEPTRYGRVDLTTEQIEAMVAASGEVGNQK